MGKHCPLQRIDIQLVLLSVGLATNASLILSDDSRPKDAHDGSAWMRLLIAYSRLLSRVFPWSVAVSEQDFENSQSYSSYSNTLSAVFRYYRHDSSSVLLCPVKVFVFK